jgi:hypothetical protein
VSCGGHALHIAVFVVRAGCGPFLEQNFTDTDDGGQRLAQISNGTANATTGRP